MLVFKKHQRADPIHLWPTNQSANTLAFQVIVELLVIINMLLKNYNRETVLKLRIRTIKGSRSEGATSRGVAADSKRTLQLTEVLIILHLHT